MSRTLSTVSAIGLACLLSSCAFSGMGTPPTDESDSGQQPPRPEAVIEMFNKALGTDSALCEEVVAGDGASLTCEKVSHAHSGVGTESVNVRVMGAEIVDDTTWSEDIEAEVAPSGADPITTNMRFYIQYQEEGVWKVQPEEVEQWAEELG